MRSIAPCFRRLAAVFLFAAGALSASVALAQESASSGTIAPGLNPDDPIPELIFPDMPLEGVLSNLEYTLRVTEVATGRVKSYHNPPGNYCGGLDSNAF